MGYPQAGGAPRPAQRAARLQGLQGKTDDTLTALGSDIMSASLGGNALLRSLAEGPCLEALRQDMSARFSHRVARKAFSLARKTWRMARHQA